MKSRSACVRNHHVAKSSPTWTTQFIVQALVDWTRSNTHFSSEWFIMQHITNTWGLQQCIVLWCWHQIKMKHMLLEGRAPSCWCQQRQHEGKSLFLISRQMWWAETGQWCRLPLGQLLYSHDWQVWTKARPTTPRCAPSGSSVQSWTEREHQATFGRLTTCVLCLCDSLQVTNKQSEADHCRTELKCFAKHKTWQRAGRRARLVNACCEACR